MENITHASKFINKRENAGVIDISCFKKKKSQKY